MSRRSSTPVASCALRAWTIGVAGATVGGLGLLSLALAPSLLAPTARLPELDAVQTPRPARAQSASVDACERTASLAPEGDADELTLHLIRREWPAATAVIAGFPDIEDRLTAWPLLLEAWAESEPAAALQFAQTRLPVLERGPALAAVVQGWAKHDLPAASAWLETRPPQAENDDAFAILAGIPAVVAAQPRLALDWARNVTDYRLRWETTRAVVQRWAQRDESAARDYVDCRADLTPEQRALLLRRVAQRTALLD